MKILVIAPYYPYADYPAWGAFNERAASTLTELCDKVEVLAPRPYAPPVVSSLVPRWRSYSHIVSHEIRNGIPVYRPRYIQIPRLGGAIWTDPGAFFWSRGTARDMHSRVRFDAIISFDLVASGGMAWRIGQDLGIVASGWAIGNDVRFPATSSHGQVLLRAIKHLDLVFYQSHELLEKAAELLGSQTRMLNHRHVVLARGIAMPPSLAQTEVRNRTRNELDVKENQILVLSVGRIVQDKGMAELLEAIALTAATNARITCFLVGSKPAFDDTVTVQKKLNESTDLRQRVKLLPSCSPDKVWEYLCAADIFAFPSHKEGMPNSLLEAMAMGVPAVAFAIPAVLEIEAGTGCVIAVKPFSVSLFSEAILRLAMSAGERASIGEKGRARVIQSFMIRKNMAEALERISQIVENRKL